MSWACDQGLTSNIVSSYQLMGPLFVQTLQSFLAAQCALTGDHLWPEDATAAVLNDPNYDFIVIGAGSAGSVVANRLSENPDWKVLLVEAGGNPNLLTENPQLFYNSLGTSVDWNYYTQPQEGACRSTKRKGCSWPRGKVLGGSSSINGMFYVRGNKADYDQWAADGNYGWSYEEVLPYFLKIENFNGDINQDNKKYHSKTGPINIVQDKQPHPLESLIIQAATELGIKNLTDINGPSQMGIVVADTNTNTKDNYRVSTARGYLSPVKERKNLHVMKNAFATQILFTPNTNRISGVLINKYGKEIVVNANKEVILSGGSVNSPQLLMLSGLGPKKHLEEMGIEVKADLPVGENLQDHISTPIFYSKPFPKDMSLHNLLDIFTKYVLEGTGPLFDTRPHRVISFMNTTDSESSIPDSQFHYFIYPPSVTNMLDMFDKLGISDEAHQKFLKINEDKLVIAVFAILLSPKSKGKIVLASKNPFEKPLIYADYFKDPEDIECLIRAIKKHSLRLGDTKAFQEAGMKLDWIDLDACKEFVKGSDKHLECMARELSFSVYHPTSTVKMGTDDDPTSVVDSELRVRQVMGLRVIDASIMPSIVRGNTNVPSIMIGEKGADMIKQFWLNRYHAEL